VKLRLRLTLTMLAAAAPGVAGIAWARTRIEHRHAVDSLAQIALHRMQNGGREQCERFPETWPAHPDGRPLPARAGPRRPPRDSAERPPRPVDPRAPEGRIEFFAYRADYGSANPDAPSLHPDLIAGLEAERSSAGAPWRDASPRVQPGALQVAVRMPWADDESPCAIVLARRRDSGPPSLAREFLMGAAVVLVTTLGAVLLAAGPLVHRIRRLARDVRLAAADGYESPVELDGKDEVTELGDAFNAAAAELREHSLALERRERSLRDFVANTTHDVMLPLTVLQGHLVALRGCAAEGSEEAPLVHDALEESHYMASLVQNLGTAARLEAQEPELRRDSVDLVALAERVVARHRPVAEQKGIAIEPVLPGEPLELPGDVTLLEQALGNVVHNAVRYGRRDGRVLLLLKAQGEGFSLRVIDDGPGIPPEQLERLTDRRWRGDAARSRHPDGSGLGLAISREVALRHGLRLDLRRSEMGGLEVEFVGPE